MEPAGYDDSIRIVPKECLNVPGFQRLWMRNAVSISDDEKMENEIKYRSLIAETIGECGQLCRNRVKATAKVMRDMVLSYRIIERISDNASG